MSNANVGQIYQQIIRDVVESSRVDFEEGGVDEGVLEELSRGWQMKLSQLNVAQFPWDPKPEPAPTPMANTPLPTGNISYQQNANNTPPKMQPQSNMSVPTIPPMKPQMNPNTNGPRIKSEPGLEPSLNPIQPAYNPPQGISNATTAQQRAAQNLQARYGAGAAASINAIHSMPQQSQQQNMNVNMQQNMQQTMQQQQRPPIQQQPGQQQSRPPMTQAQYQQAMAQEAAHQRQQLQSQSGINGAQTDGAGDIDPDTVGIMTRFDARGNEIEMGRVEIDHLIRRKVEAMGQRMEGGGLMLPLNERKSHFSSKKRKVPSNPGPPSGGAAQFDGPDDGSSEDDKSHILKADDADEDAINSDLDDPDDGLNDEEDDDDSMGHIMLCMYDKVQRVKNKWKCVMKDGVLTVNGKEYVFHKATGEYEW